MGEEEEVRRRSLRGGRASNRHKYWMSRQCDRKVRYRGGAGVFPVFDIAELEIEGRELDCSRPIVRGWCRERNVRNTLRFRRASDTPADICITACVTI